MFFLIVPDAAICDAELPKSTRIKCKVVFGRAAAVTVMDFFVRAHEHISSFRNIALWFPPAVMAGGIGTHQINLILRMVLAALLLTTALEE